MRNVLVFPDGTELDFTYPKDRKIKIGLKLNIEMLDDSSRIVEVYNINKSVDAIYYHLKYS